MYIRYVDDIVSLGMIYLHHVYNSQPKKKKMPIDPERWETS